MKIATLIFALALASGGLALAQAEEGSQDVPAVVRTYNVADLVRETRDYPLGGTSSGLFSERGAKEVSKDVRVEALVDLVQDVIDPDSWKDNGGSIGGIRFYGTSFIITQTERNHARIAELLASIRKEEGPARIVTLTAYWLQLSDDDLRAIRESAKAEGGGSPAPLPVVKDDFATRERIYWRAQTVCFSGQTVHVKAGRLQSYVSDITPIVGDGSVGYDPEPADVVSGVSLQVMPQLIPNSEMAILDLTSLIQEFDAPEERALALIEATPTTQPVAGAKISTSLDRVRGVSQEFGTTVRVPLGRKCLIGGMTMQAREGQDAAREIYLVVELTASE